MKLHPGVRILQPPVQLIGRQLIVIPTLAQVLASIQAAAGAWSIYNDFALRIADGTWDLDGGLANLKMALFLSTSNAGTLTNNVYGDLTNEHSNANGYTTGGVAMSGTSWTRSGGTATFTASAATWTASGGSIVARRAVIYYNATVNTVVKPLLCTCLLDSTPADVTVTTGNILSITPNASGIFTLA